LWRTKLQTERAIVRGHQVVAGVLPRRSISALLLGAQAMLLGDDVGDDVHGADRGELARQPAFALFGRRVIRSRSALAVIAVVSLVLTGCGLSDGPGSFVVDPGHYDSYHCGDLVKRWKALNDREKELRNLMDKASAGGGGTVIGTIAYGTDYQTVLTEKKIVQQQAAEKNCELVQTFQSDQTVR
jgi:hypothetical protein